jgi:hypothetical protein
LISFMWIIGDLKLNYGIIKCYSAYPSYYILANYLKKYGRFYGNKS